MQVPIVRYWFVKLSGDYLDLFKKALFPTFNFGFDAQSDRAYVQFNADLLDPTVFVPTQLPGIDMKNFVESVTCRLVIDDNFCQEGIYRDCGVTLQVKTDIDSAGFGDSSKTFVCQRFNFSGPSIKAIRTVYTNARQGLLKPQEAWTGNKFPRIIRVTRRHNDYKANIKDQPGKWEAGRTIEEAVGKLVESHQHELGLYIQFTM